MRSDARAGNVVRLRPAKGDEEGSRKVGAKTDVRSLIPGGMAVQRPVWFSDDHWDLRGHESWRSKAGDQRALDFASVPERWRAAAKEMTLLCLDPSLASTWAPKDPTAITWPENQEPIKLITAQANLKALRLALQMLDRYDLIEPDVDGWARAATLMRQPLDRADKRVGATLSPGTLRMRAQQLRTLWSIRTIVDRPTLLGEEPFGALETTDLFGSGARPKLNRRRPHEDVGLCLGMIGWVFDNVADDVLLHLRWWAENSAGEGQRPETRQQGYQAMVGLLHEIATEQGVLPGTLNSRKNVTLAHSALGRLLGLDDTDEAFLWGRFAHRRFKGVPLDLEGGNPCQLPITQVPLAGRDGKISWVPRLLNTDNELQWWASALVYYAMFYVAATCGLRDLDLDCLPPGCVTTTNEVRPNGETYEVNTVRGYRQKNRTAPIPTEWKVSGRVARILRLVDELHGIYRITPTVNSHTGEPRLFDAQLITATNRSGRESVHLDLNFMTWIIKGARRLYDRGVVARHLDEVTRLNTAQLRITALQAYASRPLGLALVAQFGQWSSQGVSLGYHGDVVKLIHLADPAEADEVAQEHRGRTLVQAARNIETVRGKGVAALRDVIERDRAVLENPGPLSQSRLRSLGKRNHNIATGPYTLCIYRPDQALCGGQGAADFRLCRPYECQNSAMTVGQRAKVELRRRQEMTMAPILQRDADKIAAAMPEVVEEFQGVSDADLVDIAGREVDGYLREVLNEPGDTS